MFFRECSIKNVGIVGYSEAFGAVLFWKTGKFRVQLIRNLYTSDWRKCMAHKKVILIRHGKTPGNEEKRYIGSRTDEELITTEITEIEEKLSSILKLIPDGIDRVCSSPMKRAVQTAEILVDRDGRDIEVGKNTQIKIIDKLREIDFGLFEGKNYEELNGDERYQKWIDSNGMMDFPEGEGRDSFIQRSFEGFIEALGDKYADESILIVCHGGSIMSVLSQLTGNDYYDFMTETLGGYVLELETDNEGIHILSYDKLRNRDNT